MGAHNSGLPTVLRFARFRVIGFSLALNGLHVRRETAQIAKGWPSFRTSPTRSRVCGVSLLAHEQGIMRTLLIATDTERARPRRSVTGSVARFDRFLLFSASPECKWKVVLGNSRKLRKSIKGRQAKGCVEVGISALTRQQSRTVLFKMRSGREGAVNREANLPARSPPPAKPLCVAQNTAF